MDSPKREKKRTYTNGEITVTWDPSLCIHIMNCIRGLPQVFNSGKRPWINMQAASTQEIIQTVEDCPTNAISWKWNSELGNNEKEEVKQEKYSAEVKLCADGPILIKGDVVLLDDKGCVINKTKNILLCRCNASKNMPFCDNSHKNIKFKP